LSTCESPASYADCVTALSYLGRSRSVQVGVGAASSLTAHETSSVVRDSQGLVGTYEEIDETVSPAAAFMKTAAHYDESGWLTREEKYTASPSSPSFVRDTRYNDLGQVTDSKSFRFADASSPYDPLFSAPSESVSYDALGRVTSITQMGDVTDFEYDLHDNLVKVTAPNFTTTDFLYDDFGRVVLERSPDRGETRYRYDGGRQPRAPLRRTRAVDVLHLRYSPSFDRRRF
ncbi:MAG: hypothetical protein AAF658_18330, partial [Myxococcota bacterium]